MLIPLAHWLLLCVLLAAQWSANPQYSFGWLVPPLAIFAAWRRWHSRPTPAPPARGAVVAAVLCAVLFGVLWPVAQPNPDWRLLSWLAALTVTALSFAWCAAAGGGKWARHFAFPCAFILAAVPWPGAVEQPVVNGLMRIVASVTADLLNATGIAAVPQGGIIELKAGLLGVDEACSGVRSLQASLMAALFLGELYRFGIGRRVALLGAGIALAFLCNVGRTFFLATRAAAEGLAAVDRYHDPAGFAVLTICFVLLWLAALLIARGHREPGFVDEVPPSTPPPRALTVALGVWLALVAGGTEAWFRSAGKPRGPEWAFHFPEQRVDFKPLDLGRATLAQLGASRSQAGAWGGDAGRWLAFTFRWDAGPSRSRILARMHKPEICLPEAGWGLHEERTPIAVGDGTMEFRALMFAKEYDRTHVWYCLAQDRLPGANDAPLSPDSRIASLQAVLRRERNLGQQVIEVILVGPMDGAAADAAFRREILPMLRRVP